MSPGPVNRPWVDLPFTEEAAARLERVYDLAARP
jgi:hypothetical protein